MENHLDYKIDQYDYFIFDLDNTLYNETDYLSGAYRDIACFLSDGNIKSDEIYDFLIYTFNKYGRKKLFDKLCLKFEISVENITYCLKILRTYKVKTLIKLYPEMYDIIGEIIKAKKQIFVLTNGNIVQQENKIKSIDWGVYRDNIKIFYANKIEPKPSNKSLEFIIGTYGLNRSKILFIGDSDGDKSCADKSNVDFLFKA